MHHFLMALREDGADCRREIALPMSPLVSQAAELPNKPLPIRGR